MKTLRNAVLTYTSEYEIFNVGDYIQSLAAKQYFEEGVDEYIERESLDSYEGDSAKLILNGWFMHHPENWPPNDKIQPLFVSFHINSVAMEKMLRPESISYLKQHEPIGCRDRFTMETLKAHGVRSFFSGCLTLTLGKSYKRNSASKNVCFVDPFFPRDNSFYAVAKALIVIAANLKVIKAVAKKKYGRCSARSLIKAAEFYRHYGTLFTDDVIGGATYISQELRNEDFKSDAEKFKCADDFLRLYSKATYVITSRIHCALPCLGIGVPVFYVNNANQSETSSCRLGGLLDLFNVIQFDNGEWSGALLDGDRIGIDFNFTNKSKHISLRDNLMQLCRNFVAN